MNNISILRKALFSSIVFLSASLSVVAASFRASAPEAVAAGETFRLTYTLNARGGEGFSMGALPKAFDKVAGPHTFTSSSVQIINGKMSSSDSETFTVTLLAKSKGEFSLPVATINVDGKRLTSNQLHIRVLPENTSSSHSGAASSSRTPQNIDDEDNLDKADYANTLTKNNVFVRAIPSKTSLYEQECLMITYKLYSLVDVLKSQGVKVPNFNGFMKEEIPQPQTPQLKLEHYNGKNYMTVVLYQAILYPQHSGKITIDPFSFDFVFRLRQRNQVQSFFSGFFDTYKDVQKRYSSAPVTINVLPLPSRPADFSGGVGNLSLSSSLTSDNVAVNDPITLKYVISGAGNLKIIKNPTVEFPADFETYDPKVTNNIKTSASGLYGSKTVEYLLIPRSAGNFKIPSYSFVYFDIKSHSYKTIKSPEYTIRVSGTQSGKSGVSMANYSTQEQLKMLGQDIRYIHTSFPYFVKNGDFLLFSPKYLLLLLLPLFIAIVLFFIFRRHARINSDDFLRKNRKANKVAVKRLKTALAYMKANNDERFYDETLRALLGYAADKFGIPHSELTKDNIGEKLSQNNVSQEDIADFMDILRTCEFARYAPQSVASTSEVYDKAVDIISRIQQNLK